jgi:hypothetical protein
LTEKDDSSHVEKKKGAKQIYFLQYSFPENAIKNGKSVFAVISHHNNISFLELKKRKKMRDEMKGHDLISRREAHMMMMMPTVDAFLPFLDTLFKEKGK